MTKYENSASLKNKVLERGDKLMIGKQVHEVEDNFLNNLEVCDNAMIFQTLGIEDKLAFCQLYYGYKPGELGMFPYSKRGDFPALTRVAIALMRMAEFKTVGDAVKECECLSKEPKTKELAKKAEEFLVQLRKQPPTDALNNVHLEEVRSLFIRAEKILKSKKQGGFLSWLLEEFF